MSTLKGRAVSIYMIAFALHLAAPSASLAQSVANGGFVASLASGGSNASSIGSAIAGSNYLNLRDSVINTKLIAPLYRLRGNQPIFVSGTSATSNLSSLRSLVESVHLFGLNKEDYWNRETDSLISQIGGAQASLEAELLLTQTLVKIASDLSTGRTNLLAIDSETDFRKSTFDGYQLLNQLISSGYNLTSAFEQFEPQHQEYKALKNVLSKLYSIKANGGWSSISGAAALKPKASSADVPGIRQRLADLNFIDSFERSNSSTVYDPALVEGVKKFQAGMKLDADGICGKMCFGALKTSLDYRIAQVSVNLERWRWLPKALGDKHVFVNLARQELKVRERGLDIISMKTVNGRLLRRTPTMVDRIYEVILNPYWTSPDSIAIKDLIPNQIKDSNYFASSHIRVLDSKTRTEISPYGINWAAIGNRLPYILRQDPGPHNSLGAVKFSLTNSRAIYLHDTPHPEDFPMTTRLKSSGCVRLERPLELAEYLLREVGWDSFRIQDTVASYMTYPAHTIKLKASVPTYLAYLTASVGELGEIQFTPDYYGQDERLINASKSNEGF